MRRRTSATSETSGEGRNGSWNIRVLFVVLAADEVTSNNSILVTVTRQRLSAEHAGPYFGGATGRSIRVQPIDRDDGHGRRVFALLKEGEKSPLGPAAHECSAGAAPFPGLSNASSGAAWNPAVVLSGAEKPAGPTCP